MAVGRGSSKVGGGGGGGNAVTSVVVQSGDTIDLTGIPLIYGDKDPAVSGAIRAAVEAQEQKRSKAKSEYAIMLGANGNQIGKEYHGGKGSVNVPSFLLANAQTFTHNHPRGKGEEGCLGGTFSEADLRTFSRHSSLRTFRASAAEGTYSMTKTASFDAHSFRQYVANINSTRESAYKAASKKYYNDNASKVMSGKMSYSEYASGSSKLFNEFLVGIHNDLLAGQSKYGYTYTLEQK